MLIEEMAAALRVPTAYILKISRRASHLYKIYTIPKRTGGRRTIHHPAKTLKVFQRWLADNILQKFPVHDSAFAYRNERNIFQHASVHVKCRFLLRMDFKDFFPSIRRGDIEALLKDNKPISGEWTPEDLSTFCDLVLRTDAMTIGAPSSPALSNAVCFQMDSVLDKLSAARRVYYTRYADDLYFSCDQPEVLRETEREVREAVEALDYPESLTFNEEKTRHLSRRRRRLVTGITLGSDGESRIGRGLKRRIRSLIHKRDTLDEAARKRLAGLVAYAVGLDPDFKNALIKKYTLPIVKSVLNP